MFCSRYDHQTKKGPGTCFVQVCHLSDCFRFVLRDRIGTPFGVHGSVFGSVEPMFCPAVTGSNQAYRAISTGQLNALLRLHLRPIDVVVFHGPQGRPCFEGGFPLRCFQRLSCPFIATQHCRWHDNWSTSGTFTPVLSYQGPLFSRPLHPPHIGPEMAHEARTPAPVPP